MSEPRGRNVSDVRWNIVGMAAVAAAAVALAVTIGVGFTRGGEIAAVAPVAPLEAPKPELLTVVGDSYTEGTPMGGLGEKSWAALSVRQLRREGVDLKSSIVASAGSGYVARGVDSKLTLAGNAEKAVTSDDDLVIVFGGLNDLEVPPDEEAPAVDQTLGEVKKLAPNAKMIVIGPAWPGPEPVSQILAIRDRVRDAAERTGATFIDPIADRWFVDDPSLIGRDGTHPTDQGHVYMTEKILPYIHSALAPPTASGS